MPFLFGNSIRREHGLLSLSQRRLPDDYLVAIALEHRIVVTAVQLLLDRDIGWAVIRYAAKTNKLARGNSECVDAGRAY